MYTVRSDDLLPVHHPDPRTGPFKSIEAIDYSQCSCHPHPIESDDEDGSVITSFSYSTCPQRISYDSSSSKPNTATTRTSYTTCPQRTSYDFTLGDNNTITTRSSYSTNLQRTSYDLPLSEILPPMIDFVHPSEYSDLRSADRPSGFRRLLAKFGRRRKAPTPIAGEGGWLRAALSR